MKAKIMTIHNISFLLAGVGMGVKEPGIGENLTTRFRYINLVLGFSGELTDAHCIILLGNLACFIFFVCSKYYRIKF